MKTAEELAAEAENDQELTPEEEAQAHALARGDFIEEDEDDQSEESQEDDPADEDDDPGPEGDGDDDEHEEEEDAGDDGDDDQAPDKTEVPRIPKPRFDEVNEQKNLYKEALEREQSETARLKALLAEKKEPEEEGYDFDAKWDSYHDLVEEGDTDKAKTLLKEIRAEERQENKRLVAETVREERGKEKAEAQQRDADAAAKELVARHAVLNDTSSQEFKDMMDWADLMETKRKMTRADALRAAVVKVFGEPKEERGDTPAEKQKPSQRELAAKVKNAEAAKKQPPRMEKGSGTRQTAPKTVEEMTDDEFDKLTTAEKKRLRGD